MDARLEVGRVTEDWWLESRLRGPCENVCGRVWPLMRDGVT